MSNIPSELKFTASHEWVRPEGDGVYSVGISDHAQALLGDMVFVDLPDVGDAVDAGDDCAVAESVKRQLGLAKQSEWNYFLFYFLPFDCTNEYTNRVT